MCGIAGYNVSPLWAEKYGTGKTEAVLRQCWFHNIHRGHQAAGFFSVGASDNEVLVYKSPGMADAIFETDIKDKNLFEEAPMVLGAHTREPSVNKGDPKFNVNNHPVSYGGVHVTHNGHISNDDDILKPLPKKVRKTLGEVDSIAIPVALSRIKGNPADNLEAVAKVLSSLAGGFAFHAIWEAYPGLSLFAKGATNTLVLAWHESNHAVFYGSEKESAWHAIRYMGVKPDIDSGWTYKSMDTGTFIFVLNGMPVAWGKFNAHTKHWSGRAENPVARYLPKGKDHKPEVVYVTDDKSDFAQKTSQRSMLDKNKRVEYSRHSYNDNVFPNSKGELDLIPVLSEADRIVRNEGFVHAFFGDVEIVLSPGRVLKDVYNHAVFDNKDRWVKLDPVKDKDSTLEDSDLSWEEFYVKNKRTTVVSSLPKAIQPFKYEKEGDKGKAGNSTGQRNGYTTRNQTDIMASHRSEKKHAFKLGWKDSEAGHVRKIGDVVTHHIHDHGLIFLNDKICGKHKEKYSQHEMPRECEEVCLEMSYTASTFVDLSVWYYLFEAEEYELDHGAGTELNAACFETAAGCAYVDKETIRVYAGQSYWDILVEEECYYCGATRVLTTTPSWVKKLTHTARKESLYAC